MKNLKVKMSMLAVVIGFAGAFASSAHGAFTNKTWAKQSSGHYLNITGQTRGVNYDCNASANICTAVYPATQDPNVNPANPISTEAGDFLPL
jgi:hypothetical protein